MEQAATKLINAVDKQRTKRQMSDRKFSMQILGISPSYYCLLKQGERRITLNILNILKEKLPEVTPEVTIFFMSQGDDGKNRKPTKKSGVKNTEAYIDVSRPLKNAKKPSKNAS